DAAGPSVSCKTSSTCATSSLSSLTSNSLAVTSGCSPESCDASLASSGAVAPWKQAALNRHRRPKARLRGPRSLEPWLWPR
ncbi:hypothetical protein IscW_ISCW001932, partial [Ixodes scapularis]